MLPLYSPRLAAGQRKLGQQQTDDRRQTKN